MKGLKIKYNCASCGRAMYNEPRLYNNRGNYCDLCNRKCTHVLQVRNTVGNLRVLQRRRRNLKQRGKFVEAIEVKDQAKRVRNELDNYLREMGARWGITKEDIQISQEFYDKAVSGLDKVNHGKYNDN